MTTEAPAAGSEEQAPPAPPPERRRRRVGGCLLRVAVALAVLTAIVVVIGVAFDQGDKARPARAGFDAGAESAFDVASVNYFEQQHLYLVRLQSGEFVALYDRSPKQQELGGDSTCRVRYDESAQLGPLEQLPGMTGVLVENCAGARSVWRLDGAFSFGGGYGALDRFGVSVDAAGRVIVDTTSRSCTRSRGVIGQAPFDERRCGAGD